MKKTLISLISLLLIIASCEKDNDDSFVIKSDKNANVEIETKDVSNLKYAVYTTLEDGKIIIFFSQFNLKKLYDAKLRGKKNDYKLPNQIFYVGLNKGKEGVFPDLSKYQVGAINYTKIILNPDLSISLGASQKYMATHIVVDATKPPMELGKYNININSFITDSIISGEFNGVLVKIDMETEKPNLTNPPISVDGNFENAGYIDYDKVKEMLPIDISSLLK